MKIIFDHDRCTCKTADLCACVCPYGFMLQRDENHRMGMVPGMEPNCINCGQCVAVCPGHAITLAEMTEPVEPVDRESRPTAGQVANLLKTRRSVRVFREKQLPKPDLEMILDISRWIPTASNRQPGKWMVIHSAEKVSRISGLTVDWLRQSGSFPEIVRQWEKGQDIILRKAPCLVIVLGEQDYFWSRAEAGIALTYLELYAHAHGLGTCWAGFFTRAVNSYAPLADFLDLPDGYRVCGAVMLGYPVYRLHSIPARNPLDITWR